MARRVRIQVDYNKCVGSSICVSIAPKVFVLNKEGQASVVDPQGESSEHLREAAEGCPMSAITVEEVDGEEVTSVGV